MDTVRATSQVLEQRTHTHHSLDHGHIPWDCNGHKHPIPWFRRLPAQCTRVALHLAHRSLLAMPAGGGKHPPGSHIPFPTTPTTSTPRSLINQQSTSGGLWGWHVHSRPHAMWPHNPPLAAVISCFMGMSDKEPNIPLAVTFPDTPKHYRGGDRRVWLYKGGVASHRIPIYIS